MSAESDRREDQATRAAPQDAAKSGGPPIFLFTLGGVALGCAAVIGTWQAWNMTKVRPDERQQLAAAAVATPGTPEVGVPTATVVAKPGAVVSAGGNAAHGKELFSGTCFACHGPTGDGVPNLGPTLRASKFVAAKSDPDLIAFIKVGRMPGQPGSVMNGMMPAKGGNPALDDAGLRDIVAFLRQLQASDRADGGAVGAGALSTVAPGATP